MTDFFALSDGRVHCRGCQAAAAAAAAASANPGLGCHSPIVGMQDVELIITKNLVNVGAVTPEITFIRLFVYLSMVTGQK